MYPLNIKTAHLLHLMFKSFIKLLKLIIFANFYMPGMRIVQFNFQSVEICPDYYNIKVKGNSRSIFRENTL